MARFYDMVIEISGIKKERKKRIQKAVEEKWTIDSCDFRRRNAFFSGQGNLSGGESEDEFAERMARTVWKANGGYCEVNIKATYLEEIPFQTYSFGKKDYKRFGIGMGLNRSKAGK